MTRAQARRRRKRKAKIQRMAVWTLVYLFELLMSLVPTAVTAALILPYAYSKRGGYGIGSEWLLILLVFCFTYRTVHNWICDRIFGEEA